MYPIHLTMQRKLACAFAGLACGFMLQAQTLVHNPPAGTPVPGELIVKLDPNVKPTT